jgi:hypothetical protein
VYLLKQGDQGSNWRHLKKLKYDENILAMKGKYTCLQFEDKLDMTIEEHLMSETNHED